jgi:hypothetical protein
MRAVIRLLNVQNVHPTGIYRQLVASHGEGVMKESNMRNLYRNFYRG